MKFDADRVRKTLFCIPFSEIELATSHNHSLATLAFRLGRPSIDLDKGIENTHLRTAYGLKNIVLSRKAKQMPSTAQFLLSQTTTERQTQSSLSSPELPTSTTNHLLQQIENLCLLRFSQSVATLYL